MLAAPTSMSNAAAILVGALGMNDRYLGWSVDRQAGARISLQIRTASAPPIPPGVIVSPAAACSSAGVAGWSSGACMASRSRHEPASARAIDAARSSKVCMTICYTCSCPACSRVSGRGIHTGAMSRRSATAASLLSVLLAAVCASCTSSAPAPPARPSPVSDWTTLLNHPVASAGCGRAPAIRPGTSARLTVPVPASAAGGRRTRTFLLHVPAGYKASAPTPLVLAFHGGGGTSAAMESSSGLSALADQRGFLVAYPQGLRQFRSGPLGWDASGPADPDAHGTDDGLFTSNLISAIQNQYCVDPARIAATGMSNGGNMTGYLACVLSGRIAAFAPVEGAYYQIAGGCHPARPAAVLEVHVRTDPVAPYAGAPSRGSPDYYATAVPVWLRQWSLRDKCRAALETE